jgi:hypothetical protein
MVFSAKYPPFVIPGRAKRASTESMITDREYGIRGRTCGPVRNDN